MDDRIEKLRGVVTDESVSLDERQKAAALLNKLYDSGRLQDALIVKKSAERPSPHLIPL